jgi:hypothetical protein
MVSGRDSLPRDTGRLALSEFVQKQRRLVRRGFPAPDILEAAEQVWLEAVADVRAYECGGDSPSPLKTAQAKALVFVALR